MKATPFKISPGFAQLDPQKQIELLVGLIQQQEQTIKRQEKQIEALLKVNQQQAKKIEQLESEIRRLKKLKTKPKIRPSKMDKDDGNPSGSGSDGGKRPGSEKRSKRGTINIHQIEIIKVEDLPSGAKFKGYQEYLVQGIEITPKNQLFKLERWQLPDESYRTAELPEGIKGYHFSAELRAYILHQHHHQGVTQGLLLSQLREWGVDISSGQLNCILTENNERFHSEKKEILNAGLAVSSYIQTDDTGARHNGKNGYCTHSHSR